MKNNDVEYVVYKDNVTDRYTVYAKRKVRRLFGLIKYDDYQGLLFDGRENATHPNRAMNKYEVDTIINRHKLRYQLKAIGDETSVFSVYSVNGELELR